MNKTTDDKKKLSLSQKLAAGSLAVFAILIFTVWIIDLGNSITSPFKYDVDLDAGICPGGTCPLEEGADEENLLEKDTDKDGLSDWEELNVYETSPYLEDTDSDGFLDREEVDRGFDPNCHKDNDCDAKNVSLESRVIPEGEDYSKEDLEMLNGLLNLDGLDMDVTVEDKKEEFEKTLAGDAEAESLRELLIEAGMKKTLLDAISDEVLMESYKDVLNQNILNN